MALVIELQFALKAPFEFQGFLSPSHYCNPLASGKPTRETSWSQRAEARWKGRWGRNRATAKSAARAGPGLRRRGRPRPSASLAPPRAPRPRTQARARPNAWRQATPPNLAQSQACKPAGAAATAAAAGPPWRREQRPGGSARRRWLRGLGDSVRGSQSARVAAEGNGDGRAGRGPGSRLRGAGGVRRGPGGARAAVRGPGGGGEGGCSERGRWCEGPAPGRRARCLPDGWGRAAAAAAGKQRALRKGSNVWNMAEEVRARGPPHPPAPFCPRPQQPLPLKSSPAPEPPSLAASVFSWVWVEVRTETRKLSFAKTQLPPALSQGEERSGETTPRRPAGSSLTGKKFA